jgi:hypothetical protein
MTILNVLGLPLSNTCIWLIDRVCSSFVSFCEIGFQKEI